MAGKTWDLSPFIAEYPVTRNIKATTKGINLMKIYQIDAPDDGCMIVCNEGLNATMSKKIMV